MMTPLYSKRLCRMTNPVASAVVAVSCVLIQYYMLIGMQVYLCHVRFSHELPAWPLSPTAAFAILAD